MKLGPVDARGVLDDAVASVSPMLAQDDIEVERRDETGLPPLLADHDVLTRAVANLLTNAVKHAGRARWVGLRSTYDPKAQAVRLAVEDRGPGIPAHEQKRVFEPFFRGTEAVSSQVHGNGLGLSLVKRIAEQHGGSVEVASRAGHGTTFTLVIPATAWPSPVPGTAPGAVPGAVP